MQPETITLAVDKTNTGTTTNVVFARQDYGLNRTVYTGPGHTLISRDTITLGRTYPKRTGQFYGAAKSMLKLTLDRAVPQADGTTTVAPIIMELSASVPVGCAPADVLAVRQTLIAALDRDDVLDALQLKLTV